MGAPNTIRIMMNDVKSKIETVFDLSDMVVNVFLRDPGLLNHMFIKCGYDELCFIRDMGAVMGATFGIFQVALWIYWSAGWMLPTFGLVVGMLSNWIALKMIFEPVEPKKLCGGRIVLQGLFLKRQPEVSVEYGRIVASNVLSARNLIPAIISGPCADNLFVLVGSHLHSACDDFTGVVRPVVTLFAGKDRYNHCKRLVADKLIATLENTMLHVERQMDDAMDLEKTLTEKLSALPSADFEGLLHPVFEQDEWKLVLMGGALGVIVGMTQWYVLGG